MRIDQLLHVASVFQQLGQALLSLLAKGREGLLRQLACFHPGCARSTYPEPKHHLQESEGKNDPISQ